MIDHTNFAITSYNEGRDEKKRLKLIEKAANNMSAMAQLATDVSGMMSIEAMERFFSYGYSLCRG